MVEHRFNAVYAQRVEMSKKLGNIRPLTALVHEFAEKAVEEGSAVLPHIERVQKELYDRDILPFEVRSTNDKYKIDKLPHGDVRDFLLYVWIAYKRVEEDWKWDKNSQQYISKNMLWAEF